MVASRKPLPAATAEDIQITGMWVALQRLLDLTRQPLHPAPHVGVAGRNPHPHPARQCDHRVASVLMIAHANSLGVVIGRRTRMSAPNSISTAAASAACDISWGGGGGD